MTVSLPRFDDWLNRRLEECARDAGHDIETYVAHAVASQMTADLRRRENPSAAKVAVHLPETDAVAGRTPSALTDPCRLHSLYATGLLDSSRDHGCDRITRTAAEALATPFAALTLVDAEQLVVKSFHGECGKRCAGARRPVEHSFSRHPVASGSLVAVQDARLDPRFCDHLAVRNHNLVAYLGVPIVDPHGNALGVLCVFDTKARFWGTGHRRILGDLAHLAHERIFAAEGRPGIDAADKYWLSQARPR